MDDKKKFWYVLFVRTGSEEKIVDLLKQRLDEDNFLPFVLTKTSIYRRKGKKSIFQQICFGGYVFVQSSKPPVEFKSAVFSIVYAIKDTFRFLHYGDINEIAMRENERVALCKVFGNDFCLDGSVGFKEGDYIKIVTGSLVGSESIIKRINRKRKEAVIELEMFGSKIEVCVGLEVVEKI